MKENRMGALTLCSMVRGIAAPLIVLFLLMSPTSLFADSWLVRNETDSQVMVQGNMVSPHSGLWGAATITFDDSLDTVALCVGDCSQSLHTVQLHNLHKSCQVEWLIPGTLWLIDGGKAECYGKRAQLSISERTYGAITDYYVSLIHPKYYLALTRF